jgi:hypothetical protein
VKESLLAALIFLAIGGKAIAQTTMNSIEMGKPIEKEELSTGKLRAEKRNYQLPDNSQVDLSKLITQDKIQQRKLNAGLNYKSVRLLRYQDYLDGRAKQGLTVLENLQVHPNRKIYLVEIDAPNGIEIPNRAQIQHRKNQIGSDGQDITPTPTEISKPIKFKKAKITIVIDAETGIELDSDITQVSSI